MQKELVRAVMILNEIHVDIARNVPKTETYNDLSERLDEVRTILLELAYNRDENKVVDYSPENVSHTATPFPEIDLSWMKLDKNDGC